MDALADSTTLRTRAIATRSSFYLAMRILEPPRRDAIAIYFAAPLTTSPTTRAMRRSAAPSPMARRPMSWRRPHLRVSLEPVRRFTERRF
jgi:phytoene synthase